MFADRAQCMLRQDGPLTTPNVLATIDARYNMLVNAVIAESARWGNAKGTALANYDKQAWVDGVENLREWVRQGSNQHVLRALQINEGAVAGNPRAGTGIQGPGRAEVIIQQLRNYRDGGMNNVGTAGPYWIVNGLFPGVDAPVFSLYGGVVSNGTTVTLSNPNTTLAPGETIYYSAAGVDPRPLGGGAPAGGALSIGPNGTLSGDAVLTATGSLVARVYDSTTGVWSAMAKADFVVGTPASAVNLAITEINYNPRDLTPGTPTAGDIQSFEFIELMNTSTGPVDLTGVRFTTGIAYTFPTGRVLAPGERIVVAKDLAAFASRYPDASYPGLSGMTSGPYDGGLDNAGERLALLALNDSVIADFTYDDSTPWPITPDGNNGNGATLVFSGLCGGTALDYTQGTSWYGHQTVRGNPGGPDGDGYSTWAAANGASSDGQSDADQDGLSDLMEYVVGTHPGNSSSVIRWPDSASQFLAVNAVTDRYQLIRFTRRIALSDIAMTAQVSDDLVEANWQNTAVLVMRIDNGNGTETYTWRAPLPVSADNRVLMRVKLTCTPVP